MLLLDEPLAGLDVTAATAMRKVLRRVLARDGRSAVLITHDLLDVLTLADRVLVLEDGRIVESGSATTVLATPRSRFGARFAGVNLVDGTAGADGVLTTQWGTVLVWQPGAGRGARPIGGCAVQPCRGRRAAGEANGSPRNTVEGGRADGRWSPRGAAAARRARRTSAANRPRTRARSPRAAPRGRSNTPCRHAGCGRPRGRSRAPMPPRDPADRRRRRRLPPGTAAATRRITAWRFSIGSVYSTVVCESAWSGCWYRVSQWRWLCVNTAS